MIDVRRLIRGVAMQQLYELDMTDNDQRDRAEIRNDFDLHSDVRSAGYMALRNYYLGNAALTEPSDFDLKLNIPTDLRSAIEHVLIDYFTEGIPEAEDIDQLEDLHIELARQISTPELDEFDFSFDGPDDMLGIEDQKRVKALVNGVLDYHAELDNIIHRYAVEWPIDQVAVIDRNILRLALYEFAISKEVPLKVAINEAVELAKIYGSDSTPRFVNGVLGAVAENFRELASELAAIQGRRSEELEGA